MSSSSCSQQSNPVLPTPIHDLHEVTTSTDEVPEWATETSSPLRNSSLHLRNEIFDGGNHADCTIGGVETVGARRFPHDHSIIEC